MQIKTRINNKKKKNKTKWRTKRSIYFKLLPNPPLEQRAFALVQPRRSDALVGV